jgi:threonine synthase
VAQPTHAAPISDDGTEEILYDYAPGLLPTGEWRGDGMWRYRKLLPLDERPISYPLPVGGTPLIAAPSLRELVGLPNLWLKDETRGPTGSNKDRATALVLQNAMASGMQRVTCASTGNVAVSLAIGAAAAGKEAITFVAADVADSKLRLMLQAGATVVKVHEGYDAAFRLSRAAAREFRWIDRNTGVNPATVEAKKTVAFEIWEQLQRELPDVVVVPVGDGPTLNGMAKGFRELVACGASDRLPRLIGVQAEGCQPIKRAWESGGPVRPTKPASIADGIAVGKPVSGVRAIRDVVRSGGCFVSVSDAQMLEAMRLLATRAGIFAEPAGAAALAGSLVALAEGFAGPEERIAVLVTGSSLKTPQFLRCHGRVVEITADLDVLRKALA